MDGEDISGQINAVQECKEARLQNETGSEMRIVTANLSTPRKTKYVPLNGVMENFKHRPSDIVRSDMVGNGGVTICEFILSLKKVVV